MPRPILPGNARRRELAPNVYTEERATFFSVTYDPIAGTGRCLFASEIFQFVDGALDSRRQGTKLYDDVVRLAAAKPDAGEVVDPVTGQDLANVSAGGITAWLEWLYDARKNGRFEPVPSE